MKYYKRVTLLIQNMLGQPDKTILTYFKLVVFKWPDRKYHLLIGPFHLLIDFKNMPLIDVYLVE